MEDLEAHKLDVVEIKNLISSLEPVCQSDILDIQNCANRLEEQYSGLKKSCFDKQNEVNTFFQKVNLFNEVVVKTRTCIKETEQELFCKTIQGATKFQVVQVNNDLCGIEIKINDLFTNIAQLKSICADITRTDLSSAAQSLHNEIHELSLMLTNLEILLSEKKNNIQKLLFYWDGAVLAAEQISNNFSEVQSDILRCEPIFSAKIINDQLEILKLCKCKINVIGEQVENLTSNEFFSYGNVDISLSEFINDIKIKVQILQKAIPEKEHLLSNLKDKFDVYSKLFDDISAKLTVFEEKIPLLSSNDKEINSKQIQEVIDLTIELEKVKESFTKLKAIPAKICFKHPEISTNEIEPLSFLNERIVSISAALLHRQSKLESSLLQSGKLNDAFKSLSIWLKENTELVENQSPINAADENVLLAQIQEQKLLKKMFSDHENNFKDLQKTGIELLTATEDFGKKKEIETELNKIDTIWNNLKQKIDDRESYLFKTLERVEILNNSLSTVIKKLHDLELKVSADSDLLLFDQTNFKEQKVHVEKMLNEALALEPMIEQVYLDEQNIEPFCTSACYMKIKEKSGNAVKIHKRILDYWLLKQKRITHYELLLEDLVNKASEFHLWIDNISSQTTDLQKDTQIERMISAQDEIESHKSVLDGMEVLVKDLRGISHNLEPQEILSCIKEKYQKLVAENLARLTSVQKANKEVEEFDHRLDDLLEWVNKMLNYYELKSPFGIDPVGIKEQLSAHQIISSQILSKSHNFNDISQSFDDLVCEDNEKKRIQTKIEALKLKEHMLNEAFSKRQTDLVEGLLLTQRFSDISKEICCKLANVEIVLNAVSEEKEIDLQKEKLNAVEENLLHLLPDIKNLKALGDEIKSNASNIDSITILEKVEKYECNWKDIKLTCEKMRKSIGAAAEETEAFWSSIEDIIEKCRGFKEGFKRQNPIPIREDLIAEDILKLTEQEKEINELEDTISHLNRSIDLLTEEEAKSQSLLSLKARQVKLNSLWKHIRTYLTVHKSNLENCLDAAIKFWSGLKKLKDILLEVQLKIDEQGEPTINVDVLMKIISEHQILHKSLEDDNNIMVDLSEASSVLVTHASTENRTEVLKILNDATDQWDALCSVWNLRKDSLAHLKNLLNTYYQDKDSIEIWLTEAEKTVFIYGSTSNDLGEIRDKLSRQRLFYKDLTKHQSEIIAFSQKAFSLVDKIGDEDSDKVREHLAATEQRWSTLVESSNQYQIELEDNLLSLGHFPVVIEELLTWISQTRSILLERSVPKNKRSVAVEFSKFRTIKKDVDSHRHIAECCIKTAEDFSKKNTVTDSQGMETKLSTLKTAWYGIQQLLQQKEETLNDALEETNKFHEQLQDLTIWCADAKTLLKRKIIFSDIENVNVHLKKHSEFIVSLAEQEEIYEFIIETLALMESSQESMSDKPEIQKTLTQLKTDWQELKDLSQSKSDFLQKALKDSELLQSLKFETEVWFAKVTEIIESFSPVSTILDVIQQQMSEFEEISSTVYEKQNCFLRLREISNIIIQTYSTCEALALNNEIEKLTQHWKELTVKLKGRKKLLESNYEQAMIFFNGSTQLFDFLDDLEKRIDPTIGKDANAVKVQIRRHKECQNLLMQKQTNLNATLKAGMLLVSKTQCEESVISKTVEALRLRWDAVLDLFLDRQHRLEEALLFHGMFLDAVQTLMDWLDSADHILTSETAVMGDPETVKLLVDNHTTFQQELKKKFKIYESVIKTGESMLADANVENVAELENHLEALKDKWEAVDHMSLTKEARLKNAYELANDFQKSWIVCMQNLVVLEDELKTNGPIADELKELKKQVEVYYLFENNLNAQEVDINVCFQKGRIILRFCHPFAQSNIRHQITLLRKKISDISGWARERKLKLTETLAILVEEETVTLKLLEWITEQKVALQENDRAPVPDDFEILSKMLENHHAFQKDVEIKQLSYDNVIKNAKRKPLNEQQRRAMTPRSKGSDKRDFLNPNVDLLSRRWKKFWLAIISRRNVLQDRLDEIRIRKAAAHFKWEEWRDRYNAWLRDSKSRVLDMWRKYGSDKDNKLTREQFIQGVIDQSFCAERWELALVYQRIQRQNHVSYQDFMDALKGRKRKPDKPITESEQIHEIIGSEVDKCVCCKKFEMSKVGEGKYRFGEQHKLRLVRILRSVVMVRVGGGWENLLEFLGKNDPCRGKYLQKLLHLNL